jgi:hypothetical protein
MKTCAYFHLLYLHLAAPRLPPPSLGFLVNPHIRSRSAASRANYPTPAALAAGAVEAVETAEAAEAAVGTVGARSLSSFRRLYNRLANQPARDEGGRDTVL